MDVWGGTLRRCLGESRGAPACGASVPLVVAANVGICKFTDWPLFRALNVNGVNMPMVPSHGTFAQWNSDDEPETPFGGSPVQGPDMPSFCGYSFHRGYESHSHSF